MRHSFPRRRCLPKRFAAETLEPRHLMAALPIISEFVADNDNGITDVDGDASDWIEIYNAGDEPIDLAGWHLTDNADNLGKWTFPSVTLARDAFLVVYASGKDKVEPGGRPHTNFLLDADGEYLALVRPDGVKVSEFGAGGADFPNQREDVSYGPLIEATTTSLISPGADVRLLVPTDVNGGDTLGTTWTAGAGFDDSTWSAARTGIGYDTSGGAGAEGFALVDDFQSIPLGDLGSQNGWSTLTTTTVDVVVDPADPNNRVLSLVGLSQGARKAINVPNSTTATLFFRMRRGGQTNFSIGASDIAAPSTNFADYEAQLNIQDGTGTATPIDQLNARDAGTFRAIDTWADNTWYSVWMVLNNATDTFQVYMQGGALATQTLLDAGAQTSFGFRNGSAGNALVSFLLRTAANHTGATLVDDVYIDPTGANLALPLVIDYMPLIDPMGDVTTSMLDVGSGVYARLPFTVSDPTTYSSLAVRMRYEDGFVAYLNGVEVARRNAPGSPGTPPSYTSVATQPRPDYQAIVAETIDLTPHLGTLSAGENVLAIHGLNVASGDNDFLLVPELVATTINQTASLRYFRTPTPGSANNAASAVLGFVADTRYVGDPLSFHERGLYDAPFDVTLTTDTPGATLVYTTNGSAPSLTNGTQVAPADAATSPATTLSIATTTTLRVAAFKTGYAPADIDTQTYLFTSQVLNQSGAGLPTAWGAAPGVDYGMDPEVYNNPAYQNEILDDLLALPTVSLTMDVADLWGPNGIYSNTMSQGPAWERAVSMEMIYPDGRPGFQIDAGVQIQGGASREVAKSPKHSFRILFKDIWGPDKLNAQLFDESATTEFDALILRAGFNNSWIHWNNQQRERADYVRDQWASDTQRAMGQLSKHGNFVHLYLNGLYWGLYNLVERPEESFAAQYLGGEKADYDVINNTVVVVNGDINAWNAMMSIAEAGVTTAAAYQSIQQYLDLDNFIDYMILNFYGGNLDWDDHNWYAARRSRVDGVPVNNASGDPDFAFKFFSFDAERILESTGENRTGVNSANRPTRLHQRLIANADYRLRFADRVRKHFFNDGALTPANAAARFMALADQVNEAVVPESARWGDYRRDVHSFQDPPYLLYTRDAHWTPEYNRLVNQYFPVRSANVLSQLTSLGLYTSVVPPTFNQHGGTVASGFNLTMTAPAGTIYYTTDGSEPIVPVTTTPLTLLPEHSTVCVKVPTSSDAGDITSWRTETECGAGWTSGNAGVGFDQVTATGTNFLPHIGVNVESEMVGANSSVWVRSTFNVDDPSLISTLALQMQVDDGYVAYLNGFEVHRIRAPATLGWNSAAAGATLDPAAVAFANFDISAHVNRLVVGTNVLAIHGLNATTGTNANDLLISPRVVATTTSGTGVSPTAQVYTGPVPLYQSGLVKARVRSAGNWSALNEAFFTVQSPLRVSEINYHPGPRSQAEIDAGFLDDDDFEFIEVVNTGPAATVDMAGVRFVDGIQFMFPIDFELAPLQRAVVVRNRDAFRFRHGENVVVAGEYGGTPEDVKLSNNGEVITLVDQNGGVIQSFRYEQDWYTTTDGQGPSLVVLNEAGDPANWELALWWRPSYETHGSPGETDWFVGDFDGNLRVSATDLAYLQGRLAASGATRLTGDLSGDGTVDRTDVAQFVSRYGRHTTPPPPSPAAAPDAIVADTMQRDPSRRMVNRRRREPLATDQVLRDWPSPIEPARASLSTLRRQRSAGRGAVE
jgi:hypothetical protein